MINARVWKEIGPKWPNGYWDDWLREPQQRKNRATIRPEVSRSFTFGEQGVSQSMFYSRYLANIKLNDVVVNWPSKDLSYVILNLRVSSCVLIACGARRYLQKAQYDNEFHTLVEAAPVSTFDKLPRCRGEQRDYRVLYGDLERNRGNHPPYVALGKVRATLRLPCCMQSSCACGG